jgi:hypothetical protein
MTVSAEPMIGRDLLDRDNRPSGKIRAIYRYPPELEAPWGVAAVVSGRLLRSMHLVDLKDADIESDAIRVPYERATFHPAGRRHALRGPRQPGPPALFLIILSISAGPVSPTSPR